MPLAVIDRLVDAVNRHDIDALTGCFAPAFECLWPAHPARSFTGRDQIRRNWESIFATFPDIQAVVAARAGAGDEVWAEWEFLGSGRDGARLHQRGVIVVVVDDDVIARSRFYLEPVDPQLTG
ncbi:MULTISPECIES: nuclear transport factor 2 family protein [unclassified Modestobacter]